MTRWVVVLMTLLLTLDALPPQVLLANAAHKPAFACCCKGVCHCSHCRVHRPSGAKLPPGTCVVDCGGCAGSASHGVTIPSASCYELPCVGVVLTRGGSVRAVCVGPGAPAGTPERQPDPPPRLVAA